MKNYKQNNFKKQAGMTLIELTVVLLILIGLAGLMIPYVAGFIEKTHDSTTLTNLTALDNAIPQFRLSKSTYPDGLETLIAGNPGTDTALTGVGSGTTVYTKLFKTSLFSASGVGSSALSSLNKAGINGLINNVDTTADATFKSTFSNDGQDQNARFAPDADTKLAFVAGDAPVTGNSVAQHMAYTFGGSAAKYDTTCHAYIAFGIGQDNDMIGTTIQTAPVHFSADGDSNPRDKYSRYVAVFQVQTSVGTTTTCPDSIQPAKFIGTAMNMDFGALIGTASSQAWAAQRSQ